MTTPPAPDQLLTVDELAPLLGVRPGTIYAWRHRGHFPDPDATRGPNGGVYLWRWATIEGWDRPGRAVGRPQA